jgi:hypothetical protein
MNKTGDIVTLIKATQNQVLLVVADKRVNVTEDIVRYFSDTSLYELVTLTLKQLQVAHANYLQEKILSKSFQQRVIVVSFFTFLEEAQNKMLKVLEEIPPHVRCIFITESKQGLLPTLLSRCETISMKRNDENKREFAKLFLQTEPHFRMDLPRIKSLLTKKDADDKKDKEAGVHLIQDLLEVLPNTKQGISFKAEISEMFSYAYDTGASHKMILSYLAYTLPHVLE